MQWNYSTSVSNLCGNRSFCEEKERRGKEERERERKKEGACSTTRSCFFFFTWDRKTVWVSFDLDAIRCLKDHVGEEVSWIKE